MFVGNFGLNEVTEFIQAVNFYSVELFGWLSGEYFQLKDKEPENPLVSWVESSQMVNTNSAHNGWSDSLEIHHFTQLWGNTAGGWSRRGIMSGQAFSTYYTTLIYSERYEIVSIFFSGRYAYTLRATKDVIENVLQKHKVKSIPEKVEGDILFITLRK